MVEHLDELALADTRDMGKPISDARGKDVPRAAQNFRFFADHARLATAETLPMDTGHHAYTPLRAGRRRRRDRAVELPADAGDLEGRARAGLGQHRGAQARRGHPGVGDAHGPARARGGLPAGRAQRAARLRADAAGSALTEDRRVDRITFTGESNTGRAITGAAARNLTPVSLELGGKGANLVFDDADLDNAVDWSIKAIFCNAGPGLPGRARGCTSQRGVYDEFLDRFVAAAEALRDRRPEGPGHRARPARVRRRTSRRCAAT